MDVKCLKDSHNSLDEQLVHIGDAVRKAIESIDEKAASSPSISRSISVVEKFLKKTGRLCYGGQAINAHMPTGHKLYNPKRVVPDYDFFSPTNRADADELVDNFRREGFAEIHVQEGVHKGTIKIYVDFVPIADITDIDDDVYKILYNRRFIEKGISYVDANMLRMLMYIELSRPMGEVIRWPKIYERLLLLNKHSPMKKCTKKDSSVAMVKSSLDQKEVGTIMNYIIHENRVFAGADLVGLYSNYLKQKKRAVWILRTMRPIYVFTQDIEKDSLFFKREFDNPEKKLDIQDIDAADDMIPSLKLFIRDKVPFLILIAQNACSSYYSIPIKDDQSLRVASLDTLISLFFSMSLLKNKQYNLDSLECLAKELIDISCRARVEPDKFPFAFISLDCMGHQKSKTSLVRSKVFRRRTERRHKERFGTLKRKKTVVATTTTSA